MNVDVAIWNIGGTHCAISHTTLRPSINIALEVRPQISAIRWSFDHCVFTLGAFVVGTAADSSLLLGAAFWVAAGICSSSSIASRLWREIASKVWAIFLWRQIVFWVEWE